MFKASCLKAAAAISMVIAFIFINVLPVRALVFSDITGHWARDPILRLSGMQIVNGFDGKFAPQAGVTRAEFAVMTVKALGLGDQARVVTGSVTGYRDVGPSHWASGFIIVARELGIVSGYPDGTFRPSAMIRRDEITSVLVRALKLKPADDMQDPRQVFTDGEDIPGWVYEAVKTAYDYRFVSGYPDGGFYPARNATRGETAVLIEKVLEHLGAQFTFYGIVQSVNTGAGLLTMDINGQVESFNYRPETQVRIAGKPAVAGDLKHGAGVLVIVDDDGYISFIQTVEEGNPAPANTKAGRLSGDRQARSFRADESTDAPVTGDPVTLIITTVEGAAGKVAAYVQDLGGRVSLINDKVNLLIAQVREPSVGQLEASPLVENITRDRQVRAELLAAAEEPGAGSDDSSPGRSLNATKEAIKAPQFVNLTNADGKHQKIAIIDTGVDVGHPDLRFTSDSNRKIIDWQDFTGEGDIDTGSVAVQDGRNVVLANGSYYLGDIASAGGRFKYGYLREIDLVSTHGAGFDLNFNGNESDIFGIIVADTRKAGIYDTVYVDTDSDYDFSDETPLGLFRTAPDYAGFAGKDGRDKLNFVLTRIDAGGSGINLGFDGNDHGTHVAGIAAANGRIKGVAPGAQLMVLKVLDSAGYGELSTIIEAMTYAATHGAKIINLSLGFPAGDSNGGSVPAILLNTLTEEYGVIFVAAAGNDGPGLSSVATPGDAGAALSIGAFNNPDMWKTDYGWDVPGENLWFFSAVGPRKDGALSPTIVAPGSAVSTVPLRKGKQYILSEGTSMAAPHVSGAIALLMEVAGRKQLEVSPAMVKRAVESGARTLPEYAAAEQGYGALNLTMSWVELLSQEEMPKHSVQVENMEGNNGPGIFFREGVPGNATIYIDNRSGKPGELQLSGSAAQIKPGQESVYVPPDKTRAVNVNIDVPEEKGLYSYFVSGDDPSVYGREIHVPVTVVNPYVLSGESGYRVEITDQEKPAQYKRYFFKVPDGAETLTATLTVPGGAGRARIFLYDPAGRPAGESEFAGVNPEGNTNEVLLTAKAPKPGIWEAIVYSSASLSAYNLSKSEYRLKVSLSGAGIGNADPDERDIVVGIIPGTIRPGKENSVTVQVRDRATKKPFAGFVEIDGRVYTVRNGRVTIPMAVTGESAAVIVRTVPEFPGLKPWETRFTFQ